MRILISAVIGLFSSFCFADCDFYVKRSNDEIDAWLTIKSSIYREMIKDIRARPAFGTYIIKDSISVKSGNTYARNGRLEIHVNPELSPARKISTIIFEMSNVYFNPEHQKIDLLVDKGFIKTKEEFGLAHEIYEYEAIRMHKSVIGDINNSCNRLPKEFYHLVSIKDRDFEDYKIPDLDRYLENQLKSGHTAHYYLWFSKRKKI